MMDCVVLCSYGLKKKTTAQDSHFHSHETVELPTAAAPHSKIYLTAKNRKQIHSVTFFQPPAVDITMYICVCVSQEDFFFDEDTKSQEAIKPFSILCIILVNFLQSVFI